MKVKTVLRAIWYYCFIGGWKARTAYKANFAANIASLLLSVATYYFIGYSIIYQRGIVRYGTDSPLGFLLSGILLTRIVNPFRLYFPLTVRDFYYLYSRPVSPALILLQEWISAYIWFTGIEITLYAVILASTQNLNVRPESLFAFIALCILMNIGYNLFESGLTYITKKKTPIFFARQAAHLLFSGELFPVTALPVPLQQIALLYPYTWTYIAWRKILFSAMTITDPDFIAFTIASLTMFLLGLTVFKTGYNEIYKKGLVL